jgi:hypothetical protein
MRYQVRRGWRVVLLVPLSALLLGAGSATASYAAPGPVTVTSEYSYVPLLASRDVFPGPGEQQAAVLTTPAFMMQPGEIRRVTDQLDISMPSGHDNPEVGNTVICFDQHGQEIGRAGSGTNYTGNGHAYQWNASMLLVAPAQNPAENYFCQIWTYVTSGTDTGYHMTVLAPTPGQMTYGTWLEVSSANEAGARTWSDGIGTCQTNGTGACQYIGGPAGLGNPTALDVFSPADVFPAGNDATTIDAVATFQITSCPSGTGSCRAGEHGSDYYADGVAWLDVDQLYPDGSVCQVNQAFSEQTSGGVVSLTEPYDISDQQHHRPLYFHVSAPVSQLCGGSREFGVDVHIGWTAGNPVKIDGGSVNVINSVRATTTTTVPDVTGLTQAQAEAAIATAGLTLTAPAYVTATAPPGTVLAENSPGGTIEPAGSPVQITVSLGQATVPNVIGDLPAAAVQAIKKAGLTAVTLPPISNCADPGTVQYQDPAGGAQVPAGSQVDIRVTACTR